MVIFAFILGHPLGCIYLSFSVLLSGTKKSRSCGSGAHGSCMAEEFVSDFVAGSFWVLFSCFCFLNRFRSALMGTGFVMAGFLRLSVHLRRSSSFIGLRTHWYGATLHGSAWLNHSWLNRRCYPVVRCMAAIYRMFCFTLVLPSTLLSGHSI